MKTKQRQQPRQVLGPHEVQDLIAHCKCGILTKDKMVSVLRQHFALEVDHADNYHDLAGLLVTCLKG